MNFLCIVGFLGGLAGELLLAVSGCPAVGGHPLAAPRGLSGGGGGFRGGDDMYLPLRLYCLFHEGSLPNLFYGYLKVTVTALSAVMVIYLIA